MISNQSTENVKENSTINLEKEENIIKGILKGFFLSIPFSELSGCLKELKLDINKLEGSMKKIEVLTYQELKEGISELGQSILEIPMILTKFEVSVYNVEKFVEAIQTIIHPTQFIFMMGEDLLLNGVSIYNLIKQMKIAYKSQSWLEFGENFGMILHELVIHP